ncbi:hypothetical protein RI054_14g69540 [Pseudoscourfieldia marina]
MALTTSQRGDLYRLARFGSEPEREEASRLLLEDATAHLARLRSTATDSTGTPRTPVHELVVQSAEKRLRDAEELFATTKTEAEDSEATIVLPQQQQQELGSVRKPAQHDAEFDEPQLGQDLTQSCNNNSNNSLSTTARVSLQDDCFGYTWKKSCNCKVSAEVMQILVYGSRAQ